QPHAPPPPHPTTPELVSRLARSCPHAAASLINASTVDCWTPAILAMASIPYPWPTSSRILWRRVSEMVGSAPFPSCQTGDCWSAVMVGFSCSSDGLQCEAKSGRAQARPSVVESSIGELYGEFVGQYC